MRYELCYFITSRFVCYLRYFERTALSSIPRKRWGRDWRSKFIKISRRMARISILLLNNPFDRYSSSCVVCWARCCLSTYVSMKKWNLESVLCPPPQGGSFLEVERVQSRYSQTKMKSRYSRIPGFELRLYFQVHILLIPTKFFSHDKAESFKLC